MKADLGAMKQSNKKIDSRAALQLEKARLRAEIRGIETDLKTLPPELGALAKLVPMGRTATTKTTDDHDNASDNKFTAIFTSIAGSFLPQNELVKTVLDQVSPMLGKRVQKIAITVGKELIGGYLKWKAVELSVKGVRYLVRKSKKKKDKEVSGVESRGKNK